MIQTELNWTELNWIYTNVYYRITITYWAIPSHNKNVARYPNAQFDVDGDTCVIGMRFEGNVRICSWCSSCSVRSFGLGFITLEKMDYIYDVYVHIYRLFQIYNYLNAWLNGLLWVVEKTAISITSTTRSRLLGIPNLASGFGSLNAIIRAQVYLSAQNNSAEFEASGMCSCPVQEGYEYTNTNKLIYIIQLELNWTELKRTGGDRAKL